MKRLFSISITFFSLSLVFCSHCLEAKTLPSHSHNFSKYQKTLSKEQVKHKISAFLEQDPEIKNWYTLFDDRLEVYANLKDKLSQKPEFTFFFGNQKHPQKPFPTLSNPHMPLKGLRVAIDPGHFGGELAKLEEKYVSLKANSTHQILENIQFDEGTLTLITAKKLARKLESLGAKVFLTKSSPGSGAYKKSFQQWMKDDFDQAVEKMLAMRPGDINSDQERIWWKEKASLSTIFKSTYNYLDIQRRADLINTFKPHVTICCHYNLGYIYDQEGNTPGTTKDYFVFFVPGAFQKNEARNEAFAQKSLATAESRYDFVRFLLTDDIEKDLELAYIAVDYSKKILKTPIGDNYWACIENNPGILHRNLAFLRQVHGPILYGEPLCQDNYLNAKLLANDPDVLIDKVVHIYLRTLLDWAEKQKVD